MNLSVVKRDYFESMAFLGVGACFRAQPWFCAFYGCKPGFGGVVRIAQETAKKSEKIREIENYQHHHHLNLSILSGGGGNYRGIYDIGLKRGLLWDIGLLLNAPYKIDSMVWMRIGMSITSMSIIVWIPRSWLKEPNSKMV
jgi:hypothetical protein